MVDALALTRFLPLVAALAACGVLALSAVSDRVGRVTGRVALAAFGDAAAGRDSPERVLEAAHISVPYPMYVARTRLLVTVAGVVGAVLGVYAGAGLLVLVPLGDLGSLPGPLAFLAPVAAGLDRTAAGLALGGSSPAETILVVTVASLLCGAVGSAGVYGLRRWRPRRRAERRRRDIDANIARTVAFVYALSRGGSSFPDVLRALARNEGVFGEAAAEAGVAVRNIDLFGRDVVTALRHLADRTPSEEFRAFAENTSSVLQSGRALPEFLRDQYDRYSEQIEDRQEEILEQLATVAEAYVTVVVAGMLFLITVLMIIGLTTSDTLGPIRLCTYVVLPLLNLAFIAYLSDLTSPLRARRDRSTDDRPGRDARTASPATPHAKARTDGGLSATALANRERLQAHRRVSQLQSLASRPLAAALQRPIRVLYVAVPLAAGYLAYELVPPYLVLGEFSLARADDVVVLAGAFVMGSYAAVHELSKRRLERRERALPEMLDRLASLNEAGVTVVGSLDRLRDSDLGAMDEEVERIWRDVTWGATVREALARFERRVRTPAVTRVVTLVNNAMAASNDIGPVLRIAADQARADRRFKRQRRQEMFTYVVAIYVAFAVFLVVIAAIDLFFIPRLLEASGAASSPGSQALSGTGLSTPSPAAIANYRLAFFHAALVQAVLSGLIGGQMGEGSVRDGVKHAAIMLTTTYVVFELLGALL
jgi:flagellar protein FlaJ